MLKWKQILAYADGIVITGRLLAKEMGLTVNENKTEFMALNGPAYSNLMHNRSFMI
jgi:hypothetical protein